MGCAVTGAIFSALRGKQLFDPGRWTGRCAVGRPRALIWGVGLLHLRFRSRTRVRKTAPHHPLVPLRFPEKSILPKNSGDASLTLHRVPRCRLPVNLGSSGTGLLFTAKKIEADPVNPPHISDQCPLTVHARITDQSGAVRMSGQ